LGDSAGRSGGSRARRAFGVRRPAVTCGRPESRCASEAERRRRGRQNRPPQAEVSTDFSSKNSAESNSKPATAAKVSTDLAVGRSPTASACEPYRELIGEALARGRNARAIWQDLVDDHGFAARYASVLRFVRKLRGTEAPEARVVITTAPGEECQVDYGDGPMGGSHPAPRNAAGHEDQYDSNRGGRGAAIKRARRRRPAFSSPELASRHPDRRVGRSMPGIATSGSARPSSRGPSPLRTV
jgi:hypothetical protein